MPLLLLRGASRRSLKLLLSAYADLPHQADHVIEEVFLYDFSLVTPMGNCTEVDLERLSSGRDVAPVPARHGPRHSAGKASDGAGPIAAREQDLVGTVMDPVVRKCLEEADALSPVLVPPMRGRLGRPANNHVVLVPLVEGIPVLCVPGIIQSLHQFEVSLLVCH